MTDDMSAEERQRRIAVLLAEEYQAEQRWYYLSYESEEQGFVGACWVKAGGLLTAVQNARDHGIHPDEPVKGALLLFAGDPPEDSAYKLHANRDEINRLLEIWRDGIQN